MPRKRRERASKNKTQDTTKEGGKKKKRRTSRKRFKLDVKAVSKDVAEEVVKRLGLDLVGISVDDILDIVENIVSGIAESRATKPSTESIIKRILASKDNFRKAVAVRLFELKQDDLSLEQLEFIVSYAPELAGRAAPILYKVAKKYNAEYIVSSLQVLWNKYGRRTPLKCPRCGFYAVTPDLTCMVCGAVLSEEEVKRSINFKDRLREFAKEAPTPLLREVYQAGFIVLNDKIHPPSMAPRAGFRVEIHLTSDEKVILANELKARGEL